MVVWGIINNDFLFIKMTETNIQSEILKYLKYRPGEWFRRNVGGRGRVRYGLTGMSDIWGVLNGQHYEIEVKKPGNKRSPDQDKWAVRMWKVGAVCILATSVEDVEKAGL